MRTHEEKSMTKLLHVSSSPRAGASESLAIAETFLAELHDVSPEIEVGTWDLWDGSLPEFGPAAATAKMAVFAGADPAGDAAAAWAAARKTFERFAAADHYLFSVPMWNHSIPYILKQLIDVVSQPGMVFGFDATTGYSGLLTGRTATVIYTSAVYGDGSDRRFGVDFQSPYFSEWLRWAGITDIQQLSFQPNLVTADAEAGRRAAHAAARKAARALVQRHESGDETRTSAA
jgi:FMN-dependent NADH-azoreductase